MLGYRSAQCAGADWIACMVAVECDVTQAEGQKVVLRALRHQACKQNYHLNPLHVARAHRSRAHLGRQCCLPLSILYVSLQELLHTRPHCVG